MKCIVFTLENWLREYEARLFLAEKLVSQSKERVVLIFAPKRIVNYLMNSWLRKVGILHKSLQERQLSVIEAAHKKKCQYYFLEEESVHRNIPFHVRFGENIPKSVKALATTSEDYESLLKVLPPEAIERTGNNRFEFYFRYHDYHKSQSQMIKDKFGSFVFFCSNFSLVFAPDDHKFENLDREDIWEKDEDKIKLHSYIKAHRVRALEVCQWLKELSNERTIIYRPHPLESEKKVTEFFSGSNVKVIREYSIVPWLRVCERLVHSGCTSAVESAYLGKKAVFAKPLEEEKGDVTYRISEHANDFEGLKRLVSQDIAFDEKLAEESIANSLGRDFTNIISDSTSRMSQCLIKHSPRIGAFDFVWNCCAFLLSDLWFLRAAHRSPKEKERLVRRPFFRAKEWLLRSELSSDIKDRISIFALGFNCVVVSAKGKR